MVDRLVKLMLLLLLWLWLSWRPECRLNIEEDLEAWRRPAQRSSHPAPHTDLLLKAAAPRCHTSCTQATEDRK